MAKKPRSSGLERWEVALIKAMLAKEEYNDQTTLAYFTRPTRSVNHRAIAEIRTETKHKAVRAANDEELEAFLAAWPEVDPQTGLSLRGDELLVKAREAMISAVHIFNAAGLTFRAELFIVSAMIAWTYLLHAWYRKKEIDYRYTARDGAAPKTQRGEDRYWDLAKCLKAQQCPLQTGMKLNLEFLIELRHEIEHRSTNRIDEAVSAKLQACCINFNDVIKELFGPQYGLERQLPIALQFVTFSADQRAVLKRASGLPGHIQTMMNEFHGRLSDAEQADPRFAFRVAFVQKVGGRASSADLAIEFVKGDSAEGKEISRVLLKEVDKRRYTASEIVSLMHGEGYPKFRLHNHTELWKGIDAKNPAAGFGRVGDYQNTWVWYETWLARVRAHCQENADKYK
jgi:Protein of unknown function (DUF3644)